MSVQTLRKSKPLGQMTDAELLSGIRARMRLTVEGIEELAEMIREARRRNLSLAEFSTGMPARLLAVADKKLDAGLLLKFCDQPTILDAVKGTPLTLQRKLAEGDTVPVVEFDRSTGETVTREKTLRQMTGPQARQVFVEGRLLSTREQAANHRRLAAASKAHASPESVNPSRGPRITADVETGHVIVGPYRIHARSFFAAFKMLGYTIAKVE